MKDAIGEWHDWEQHAGIAKQTSHPGRRLLLKIQATKDLGRAVAIANQMRRKFLDQNTRQSRARLSQAPALASVSALAA